MHFFWIICCVLQAIFQPVLHNEKWWYVIPMVPRTRPVFHTLLLADSNMAALDSVADADPKRFDDDECLQNVDYNHDDVQNDPDLQAEDVDDIDSSSLDLCIEIGSGDMIDVDEDGSLDLFIDIDPFLVIDNFVDQHS